MARGTVRPLWYRGMPRVRAGRAWKASRPDRGLRAWLSLSFILPSKYRMDAALVDGKVTTDKSRLVGFMDVISIPKTNEHFRFLHDIGCTWKLHPIKNKEAKFKLCKVNTVRFDDNKGIPYLIAHDKRTIYNPDPLIKANDTIKVDLEENKIVDFIKFDVDNVAMVTCGSNRGRVGVIKSREKHWGKNLHIQDSQGHEFTAGIDAVFIIGRGAKPWISLPKGKGVKRTIEEAHKRPTEEAAATV